MQFMTDQGDELTAQAELTDAVAQLASFLRAVPLTEAIAGLERDLEGRTAGDVGAVAASGGISPSLLTAGLTVRESFGRLNDLIHAAAITLALPHLLEDGEQITARPSLAAGNDPGRPFDVETNRRVAEFKLSRWRGSDAMRKRQTFKDLVMLAADRSGRQADLFVVGTEPGRFLRTSRSTAAWGLDRTPHARRVFDESFGSADISIAEFTASHAAHVRVTDLGAVLPPEVAAELAR